MTTIPFGSTGILDTRDDFPSGDGGGLTSIGAGPFPWATDDGDASYLRWITHQFLALGHDYSGVAPTPEGETSRAITELTWWPAPLVVKSLTLRIVAKGPVGYTGPPILQAAVWKSDASSVAGFGGIANMSGAGADYELLEGSLADGSPAFGWLATGDAFISLRWMNQDVGGGGAIGNAAGDEVRYTLIALDAPVRPPLRQFPRDDGMSGTSAPRQRLAMPSSLQRSQRQRPAGYL